MIVVDASVLIAYLDPDDTHHHEAVALLEVATPPLLVHPITAAELLVAPTRAGVAAAAWADLEAIGVELDTDALDPHQLAELRTTTRMKMPDCCVIASAANHAKAMATFDEQLARHAPAGRHVSPEAPGRSDES